MEHAVTEEAFPIPLDETPGHERGFAVALFLFHFVTCAFFFGGGGWNQNSHFSLIRALAEQQTIRLESYGLNSGDISIVGGHVYSNKCPGISFIGVVPYAALRVIERGLTIDRRDPTLLTFNAYLCTVAIAATSGAAVASLIFLLIRRHSRSSCPWAAALALAASLGTNIFPFSTLLYLHVPSTAFLLAAILFIFSSRAAGWRGGLALGLCVMTNYLLAPVALVLAFIAIRRGRTIPSSIPFVVSAAIPAAMLAAYHQVAFGSFLSTPMETMNPQFISEKALLFGIIELPSVTALAGITFSPYRGLFYLSPFLLLAVAGILPCWRRDRLFGGFIFGTIAFFLIFNSSFNGWAGGYAIGPRYLIPVIPLLVMLIGFAPKPPWYRLLFTLLALVSFSNNFVATAVDPQPSDKVANPLRDYLYPLFINGRLSSGIQLEPPASAANYTGSSSVNRQHIDEVVPFARFPVGSGESEWASFNLGELLTGPGSRSSLIPVLLWIVLGASLLLKRAARLDRDDTNGHASAELDSAIRAQSESGRKE